MKTEVNRKERRAKRHLRSRTSIVGTAERPRLSVFASLRHVTAQIIDDLDGHTLVTAGTVEQAVADQCEGGTGNTAAAAVVGKVLAERALAQGVEQVVFDRGGHKYHGRVRALAEAAREAGLRF